MSNGITVIELGERIKSFRLRAHMDIDELADAIHMHPWQLRQIKRGKIPVSSPNVERIASVLSVLVRKLTENTIMHADREMRRTLRLMANCDAYIDVQAGDYDLLRADGEMLEVVSKTCFQRLTGGDFIEHSTSNVYAYRITDEGRAELHY